MCTVVFVRRPSARYPLVIAANRDELYARPTRGPELLGESPRAVGGIDELAGGTWMAVVDTGLVVGVTNQRRGGRREAGLRSRGELVLDMARRGSRAGAIAVLESVDPRRYNSFNAFVADASAVTVGYGRMDERRVELEEVGEGIHVLPNDRLDCPTHKVARAIELAAPLAAAESCEELALAGAELLGDHHRPPLAELAELETAGGFPAPVARELAALCIHTEHYGTRSSSIVALDTGGIACYLHAPRSPCQTPYQDLGHLLTVS